MSRVDVDVAVLGGGVAGLAAAVAASREGAAVALIEPGPLGGRAAHGTMVPWRALQRAAERPGSAEDVWRRAREDAARVSARWAERSGLRLEDHGVERIAGRGRFEGPGTIVVDGGARVRFERAVIATGGASSQLGEGARVLAPDGLLDLDALPDELLVVGGGAAGAELADALSGVDGVTVTWLMDELGILPDFDRELAEALGDVLMSRGVKLIHGKRVLSLADRGDAAHATLDGGRTYAAPYAVVAIGTAPTLEGLGLETLGLSPGPRGRLSVDEGCRTGVRGIFAAGDCAVGGVSAGAADAMGRIAGRGAAGLDAAPWRPERHPRVVFARPALAEIGLTPERSAGREVVLYTLPGGETIFGALEGVGESLDSKGFLRVVCDAGDGEVIGASGAGPGAIEVIGAIGIAMELGATDVDLRRLAATLPGPMEALRRCLG